MADLLPCPFCGKLPEVFPSGERDRGEMIECITEGCVNPHVSYYGKGVARAKWNTRTGGHTLDGAPAQPMKREAD